MFCISKATCICAIFFSIASANHSANVSLCDVQPLLGETESSRYQFSLYRDETKGKSGRAVIVQ
jgi:hypothetical protein